MAVKRNQRAGIDDRWHKKVRGSDGKTRTERSSVYDRVTRWRVRWVDESGTERTKSFARKEDAKAFLSMLTADVVRGDYVSPDKAGVTFGSVAEQWFASKAHRKPKTLAGYRGLLDTLVLPRWGTVPLKDIKFQNLSVWISSLAVAGSQSNNPLSASRIRQTHQLIHAVLKYAQRSGLVIKNVAADIDRRHDMPPEKRRPQHYLNREQLLGFASRCGRFETLSLVLGTCGLRFSEAVALRRDHVGESDFLIAKSATYVTGRGMVESGTKTGQIRRVPVPPPVWSRLTEELPTDSSALVFPGKRGFLSLGEYRWVFDKAVKEMRAEANARRQREITATGKTSTPEFPLITPHSLRHTAASLHIATGANVKVVQRLLGHETAAMTLDLYGHLYDEDLARAAAALGDALEATAVSLRYSSPDASRIAS